MKIADELRATLDEWGTAAVSTSALVQRLTDQHHSRELAVREVHRAIAIGRHHLD